MSKYPNTKPNPLPSIYQTPVKNEPKNRNLLLTNDSTYEKSNQKSVQSAQSIPITNLIPMNIFKKKRYTKTIKKYNLKLLAQEASKLHDMKLKADTSSDALKQSYRNELDKVYVILGRIQNIHEDKKYYTIYCQDESMKEFKLYFLKNISSQNSVKHSNKSKSQTKRRITNLDSLEFQPKQGEGTPYFKFFVIFREIPIFENGEDEILNSEEHLLETENEEVSNRIKYKPKIKATQFRIYVEHFEKVEDFNYLTLHNMHIAFEAIYRQKIMAKMMEIFDDY